MKRSTHWILWLTLIIIFILIFPKSCGHRIPVLEENKNIIDDNAFNDESSSNEEFYNESDFDESVLYEENPFDNSLLKGEMPTLIRDWNKTQKYNCYGFLDGLIAKINKNSSIQWCYGICLISQEEIGNNIEIKNKTSEDSFILNIFTNFSNLAIILGIIIGSIIILGTIRQILNKLKTIDK